MLTYQLNLYVTARTLCHLTASSVKEGGPKKQRQTIKKDLKWRGLSLETALRTAADGGPLLLP